jgi:interferon-induced GTP-binding protein Mx1
MNNTTMTSFTRAYDDKVRPLMDKIDQVRALLSSSNDGVTFPNVVVVGDQSSGKSTLLEALSLVELPKGSGIVTRCPLVLRLRRSVRRQVYRVFDDNKKEVLDESQLNIMTYIEEETKKLAGPKKRWWSP